MFAGYINGEEMTRQKLVDGWLRTGDIVNIDEDGLFRIVGRKEDFIKVNGFKVYASEVETAIIALPWIAECAVLGERDAQGAESLVAHVVPRDESRTPRVVHD
jgi:acyl-CoA synthetase (AMP-forming)/AMP-acid ligase II